ncbi:integrase family protein [uncultured Mediterranean phage uvMED]|nr:integrase family protein [uncultured Mediterranean phage uvMED]
MKNRNTNDLTAKQITTSSTNWINTIASYEAEQKNKNFKSYKLNIYCLKNFVLLYFLEVKKIKSINLWSNHFISFKRWLEQEAKTKKNKRLSYSTINTIIKNLNSFMTFLVKEKHINPQETKRISLFKKDKLKKMNLEDAISKIEFEKILKSLQKTKPYVGDFFQVMYNTGLRFSECFSLPMCSVVHSKLIGDFHNQLEHMGMFYYGYILLKSQCATKTRKRNKDGSISRKPLKRMKSVSDGHRYIPIFDRETWNTLIRLSRNALVDFNKDKYGTSEENYLLFENLSYNSAVREFRKASQDCKIRHKGYKACRHAYAFRLIKRTQSYTLSNHILGHSTLEAFTNYDRLINQRHK